MDTSKIQSAWNQYKYNVSRGIIPESNWINTEIAQNTVNGFKRDIHLLKDTFSSASSKN